MLQRQISMNLRLEIDLQIQIQIEPQAELLISLAGISPGRRHRERTPNQVARSRTDSSNAIPTTPTAFVLTP
jgi:hypothetical protein